MKLLIAGGGGYVGSVLVPALLERGYSVHVVDTFIFGNHLPPGVTILNKNIFDLSQEDVSTFDQVIFLSGLSNDPMAEYSPSQNFISNSAAPAYLAYICKKAGVRRYIYASTSSVYGYTEDELYDEEGPVTVGFPYGVSKLMGEKSVTHLTSPEFSTISLRKGTISGYSPRMRLDLVVNTMFKCAIQDGVITVNNPAIWRPILSIQDAVSAYVRSIEANQSISGVFNVASLNCTVGSIADEVKSAVEKLTGQTVKLNIKNIQDYRNYKVNFEKAIKVLSFNPKGTIESIVADLYSNMHLNFSDFDNDMYYNIRVFKKLKENENDSSV